MALNFQTGETPIKFGPNKTVKARFWPWLGAIFCTNVFRTVEVVPFSLGSGLTDSALIADGGAELPDWRRAVTNS